MSAAQACGSDSPLARSSCRARSSPHRARARAAAAPTRAQSPRAVSAPQRVCRHARPPASRSRSRGSRR
eukprot:5666200-Pleurochrysis_carterae.AAC.3